MRPINAVQHHYEVQMTTIPMRDAVQVAEAAMVPEVAVPRSRKSDVTEDISHLGDDRLLELLVYPTRQRADDVQRLREVLDHHDGLLGVASLPPMMLTALGLKPTMARVVAAAFELGRRVVRAKRRARPSCKTPEEVVALMATELAALPVEELWVLPLDSRSCLIAEARMASRGSPSGTDADPAVIMRIALNVGASSVIVVHQHPTGAPYPSAADRAVTSRIAAAGRIVSIPLVDHLIVGDGGQFVSLRRHDPGLFR